VSQVGFFADIGRKKITSQAVAQISLVGIQNPPAILNLMKGFLFLILWENEEV